MRELVQAIATPGVEFQFEDPELVAAIDQYHAAAAERANRISDQMDRLVIGVFPC